MRVIPVLGMLLVLLSSAPPSVSQSPGPGPRFGHEMVYHDALGVVLLFGGFGPDGHPLGDTWIWDGNAWSEFDGAGPSPRKWSAAAYDARREVIVLHGGRAGAGRSGPSLADTWLWDGDGWRHVEVDGPHGRDHHRMAYDRARDRVVLFGGWDGERLVGDTWEWDGSGWHLRSREGPAPRAPVGLAYHAEAGAVVLVGGQDLARAFADVWHWDGTSWQRTGPDLPTARGFHALTYAADVGELMLFGGRDGDRLFNDLVVLGDGGWRTVSGDGPLTRGVYASAYDPRSGQLLVHGGGLLDGDDWDLDGRTWAWQRGVGWTVVARGTVTRDPM